MRLLILSDSHGYSSSVYNVIEKHSDAQIIVHLGDGERDMNFMEFVNEQARVIQVKGNCDLGSTLPEKVIDIIEGNKIYMTHGYEESVKSGTGRLLEIAKKQGINIVLYGHTHTPVNDCVDGIYLFNPGSLKMGSYGIMDITKDGACAVHYQM